MSCSAGFWTTEANAPGVVRIAGIASGNILRTFSSPAARLAAASLVASLRWRRKTEDWQATASLATTAPLHRWAI